MSIQYTPSDLAILISAMEKEITTWRGFAQFADESPDEAARYEQGLKQRSELLEKLRNDKISN